MTAYDLWFVVRSIDRSHGIIGVRGAQRSAHEEDARRPVASPGGRQQQQQQQQRCRSRLYKSFQDATDRSFMHLLPVLFETPPPSAGNVRSATTPLSHVDPRLQKKKETKEKETTTTKKKPNKKTKTKKQTKNTKNKKLYSTFLEDFCPAMPSVSLWGLQREKFVKEESQSAQEDAPERRQRGCTGVTPHGVVSVREKKKRKRKSRIFSKLTEKVAFTHGQWIR